MLRKPPDHVYVALHSLNVESKDFGVVLGWLADEQLALEKANRIEKEAVLLHQRQGVLQCIAAILERASETRAVMQKLRSA